MGKEIKVGDKLWYVANNWGRQQGSQYEVEVVKVGNKWITVSRLNFNNPFRIDSNTLWQDGKGYTSPGRCYLSKKQYDEESYATILFQELRTRIQLSSGTHSSEDILEAAKILGYKLESERQNGTEDTGPN